MGECLAYCLRWYTVDHDQVGLGSRRGPAEIGDGNITSVHVPLSGTWLLRQYPGRRTLSAALRGMKISASKRRTLHSLAGLFPCSAILHKGKTASSPACTLRCHATEALAHVQCVWPAQKEARIRVHHTLDSNAIFSS